MASRTGKTLVLAVLGLVVAVAAVGCGSGDVNVADRSAAAPASAPGDATQAPPPSSSVAPAAPATPGSALEPLTIPPERSLWALSPDSYAEGLETEVECEPHGIGPSSYGPSIVACRNALCGDGGDEQAR